MPVRLRRVSAIVLLLLSVAVGLVILTPYPTYLRLGLYAAQNPDTAVFLGDEHSQISAVKHSDESNWDLTSSQNPPVYLGARIGSCGFVSKSDVIFSLAGIWIAHWACSP